MKYTPEALQAQLDRWNKLALTLPPPMRAGVVDMREDLRFETQLTHDPETRAPMLHWELMTKDWKPTGITWPAECFLLYGEDEVTNEPTNEPTTTP